jgi:hypothetical protein
MSGRATTPGLVCAHHHLYWALARGMPAPPRTPTTFREILELVWWRLDKALDLDMIRESARLGALEALERGTTAIVDHHASPGAIEGSLSVRGLRRGWGSRLDLLRSHGPQRARGSEGRSFREPALPAVAGPPGSEVHRRSRLFHAFRRDPRRDRLTRPQVGAGVHIHVAEGPEDVEAGRRLENRARQGAASRNRTPSRRSPCARAIGSRGRGPFADFRPVREAR